MTIAPTRSHPLTESELYLFDTTGHLLLPGLLDAAAVAAVSAEVPTAPARWMSQRRDKERFDDLAVHSPAAAELATGPGLVSAARSVINQPMRMIESYALRRSGASRFYLHNGNSEVLRYGGGLTARRNMSLSHTYQDGKLYCMFVKVLIYMTDVHHDEDGPFCYLEGSHKANFARFEAGPDGPDNPELTSANFPSLSTVPASAGDGLLINEALLHGTLPKTTDSDRLVLAFSYAPAFVADWREIDIESTALDQLGHY